MDDKNINELNTFLKGEYMAIDGYENFIQKAENPEVKDGLQRIQQDHKWHAMLLSERIQDLGGHPVNGVGLTGKVAETMSNIKNAGKRDDVEIIMEAYSGEDMGINAGIETVKGDIDKESMALIREIVNTDRTHLQALNELVKKTGNLG